ncbi:MAG: GNAT family N-acetyltransferase [Spirochaetes bacterium]|nr:GNAT family N-acetyltransferase [Spirochaetota bacterium]
MQAITEKRPIDTFALDEGNYTATFAASHSEVEAAQRLRYRVFNLELNEGLPESYLTGLDKDIYDAQCAHLIIRHKATGAVVGTYRMQSYREAVEAAGFYSANEFDISQVPAEILGRTMEVGRACIHAEHRNNRVLFMLWKGLVAYLLYNRLRYLFGCCSLASQDTAEGDQLLRQLRAANNVRADFCVAAKPGYEISANGSGIPIKTPKLFQAYLNYGAQVCSQPAIDRTFKTIDYLVILDIEKIDAFAKKLFFPASYRATGELA